MLKVKSLISELLTEEVLVGIESTGHRWFDFGQFMGKRT